MSFDPFIRRPPEVNKRLLLGIDYSMPGAGLSRVIWEAVAGGGGGGFINKRGILLNSILMYLADGPYNKYIYLL